MSESNIRVHVSLDVQSVEQSIVFYREMFGEQPSKVREAYANFRLDSPPVHLALQEGRQPAKGGVSHLGFELPDHGQLSAWRNRLEASGIDFAPENDAKCCYAKADKLWVTDPDGYRWELWVRTGEFNGAGATRPEVHEQACACG